MKTKIKPIYIIGLIAALCIGFLIGISVDFPKTDQSELAGTVGKADKYRKVQMTQKDVQLRSDILKDTTRLKSMIEGLAYFSVFTDEVRANIELSAIAFKDKGMGNTEKEIENINALKDYADFIKNNNETLTGTINMLAEFYKNENADQSQDVEKNLKDFTNYVNALHKKNAMLTQILTSMDNFLLNDKTLLAHKDEITKLKSIRDQLLISGMQLGSLIGNKDQVTGLISYALTSQDSYNVVNAVNAISSQGNIGAVAAKENLNIVMSKDGINSFLNSSQMGSILNAHDLNGLLLLYDKAGLQFVSAQPKDQVNVVIDHIEIESSIKVLAIHGTEKLDVVLSGYSIQNILQSHSIGAGYTAILYQILSSSQVSGVIFSTQGFGSFLNVLLYTGFSVTPPCC